MRMPIARRRWGGREREGRREKSMDIVLGAHGDVQSIDVGPTLGRWKGKMNYPA